MQILIPDPYPGFRCLRPVVRFAGIIGVLQSLVWIALTIIGITAYYCVFDKVSISDRTVGAITQQTFLHMYFGDCAPKSDLNYTIIDNVGQKLNNYQVNIWIWVYFGIHIIWLISSITLIPKINKRHLTLFNAFLLIWVLVTLAISAMDLALGILFGLDYGDLLAKANTIKFNESSESAVILAGMSSSISMMIMSLRGFILWIVNVILLCYLFVHTFMISKANSNLTGQDNEGFTSETQSDILRQPIDAYSKTNGGAVTNSYPVQLVELNVEPLKRATAMSAETLLQLHYQRYPPGNNETEENRSNPKGFSVLAENNTFKPYPTVPDPDYSPQMVRSSNTASSNQNNRPLKSALRNSRYQ